MPLMHRALSLATFARQLRLARERLPVVDAVRRVLARRPLRAERDPQACGRFGHRWT